MRQLHPSLTAARVLIGLTLGASGCSFPEYRIAGSAQNGGAGGIPADAGDGSVSGAGAASDPAGGGGTAGEGSAGAPGGTSGGTATEGGSGGEGGAPHVPNKCADIEPNAIADDCTCIDDATHAFIFCSMTRPFNGAAAQCTFLDAHLVRLDGSVENGFVSSTAKTITMPAGVQYFWIGASTIGSPGTWHWTDDEVFWTGGASGAPSPGAYFNWRSDRPQNTATQACAYMDLQGGWQDGDCTQNRPYVCEAN